ncbi:hypothetical protein MSG28_005492 [Choristoneura fumiferana]|uniref:Uncharacterized protein n=2 Tax=Choristoneura fumiferana TaxID=7141 RepID=A0ACC0KZ01_CHOFU|nr:hypothetical protein MSG28_005492 [Choristoneura fumiferana]
MFDQMNPVSLIEEVKMRPGLYRSDQPADREEKLMLWKEVGAALFSDWPNYSKAMAYDRVLQLQKKWRSLRDAYNRELRSRKSGVRVNARVYMHFKRMSFLGGFEGTLSEDEEYEKVVLKPKKPRVKKQVTKESSSDSEAPAEELEISIPSMQQSFLPQADGGTDDSDKLFLLSFLPEMRQLPPKIKMWARAQVARVMQEAVTSQYSEAGSSIEPDIKARRSESDD